MIVRRFSTRAAGGSVRAGFTLAELLAVVAILAILAGVAIPSYMAIVNNSKLRLAKSETKRFAGMLKTFAMEHGEEYPPTGFPANEGDLSLLVSAGYLPQPPVNPWGTDTYYYSIIQNPNNPSAYEPIVYCVSPSNERIDSTMP